MIESMHLIWAVLLFCITAAWVTIGGHIPNPYVPYRVSRTGKRALLLISAALSTTIATQNTGLDSLGLLGVCLTGVWLGLVALAWLGWL